MMHRIARSGICAVGGAAAVLLLLAMVDEIDFPAVFVGGAACGLLSFGFPDDALEYLTPGHWGWVAGYLFLLDVWLMAQLGAFLTGSSGAIYEPSFALWTLAAFPSSVVALIVGSGDFGEFLVFVAPAVNALLLAFALGLIRRRKARGAR
jgi:hypothetical protein